MEALIEILEEMHSDVDFATCETLIEHKVLDSFDIISLVSEIDEAYDVLIPAEALIPENFNSAKSIYALIQRLQEDE